MIKENTKPTALVKGKGNQYKESSHGMDSRNSTNHQKILVQPEKTMEKETLKRDNGDGKIKPQQLESTPTKNSESVEAIVDGLTC